MTRRFLDDVRTDIATLFGNNITGEISPADLRSVTIDMLDSSIADEAELFSTAETVGLVLDGTFTSLATIYDAEEGDDGNFLNTAFSLGTVTGTGTAGFSYTVRAAITIEAGNNEVIEFSVGINGVADPYFATLVGDGTKDQSVSIGAFDRSAASASVYTLMARAVDGSATVTVSAVRLVVIIQPTNNP